MKIQGTPNKVVQKRVFRQGRYIIVPWFRFDANGIAELDESKISSVDIAKIRKNFTVSEDKPAKKAELKETDEEIRQLAKDKGIKSWHVKSIEKLKQELEV